MDREEGWAKRALRSRAQRDEARADGFASTILKEVEVTLRPAGYAWQATPGRRPGVGTALDREEGRPKGALRSRAQRDGARATGLRTAGPPSPIRWVTAPRSGAGSGFEPLGCAPLRARV